MAEWISTSDAVTAVVRYARVQRLVVLAGSAVSYAPPTNLPSATAIKNSLLRSLLRNIPLRDAPTRGLTQVRQRLADLPFESFMDRLSLVLTDRLIRSFEYMTERQPNRNHVLLSILLRHCYRQTLLTTNFDTMIEKAVGVADTLIHSADFSRWSERHGRSKSRPTVAKLHGCASRCKTIAATLARVARPLEQSKDTFIQELSRRSLLLIIGYSGSDPDIMDALTRLRPRQIVWLTHPKRSGVAPSVYELSKSHYLTLAACDLTRFLDSVRRAMRLPSPISSGHKPNARRDPSSTFWDSTKPYQRMWCWALLTHQVGAFALAEQAFAWLSRHTPRGKLLSTRKASLYSRRGDTAYRWRRFPEAQVFWRRQVKYARACDHVIFAVDALANLGALHYQMGTLVQAEKFLHDAQQLLSKVQHGKWVDNRLEIEGNINQNLGLVYLAQGKRSAARRLFRRAEVLFRRRGRVTMASMAKIELIGYDRTIRAERLMAQVRIVERFGGPEQSAVAFSRAGRILFEHGACHDAIPLLRNAFFLAEQVGDWTTASRSLSSLFDASAGRMAGIAEVCRLARNSKYQRTSGGRGES